LSTLSTEIEKHIKKLVNPLKDEDELKEVLKLKLTKKELKLLKSWTEGLDSTTVQKELNLDEERYGELSSKLIKKLNQEKTKQAICI
jgi:DNA-binding NarL/FixJ family response regulator